MMPTFPAMENKYRAIRIIRYIFKQRESWEGETMPAEKSSLKKVGQEHSSQS
jgi:hypothetical protein